MLLYQYYSEIKNRLLLLIITWCTSVLASYLYKEILLFLIIKPILLCTEDKKIIYFIFTDVTEIFSVFITIIFLLGNQITFVYFIYHSILFFLPGFYRLEYYKLKVTIKTIIFTFLLLVIMFNKKILPYSWNFFLSFQNFLSLNSTTLYFEAKINEYLKFYIEFYFVFVFYFLIFAVLILFFANTAKNFKLFKKTRKSIFCSFLILATLLTPPDVISQIVLCVCLITGYELIILSLILKNFVFLVR